MRRTALIFPLLLVALSELGQGAMAASIADADIDNLKPGKFIWAPELAPDGPLALIVSLSNQRVYVYRNGFRVGASTISSGRVGYETPTGVFTILEKREVYHSNLYHHASMPYMQRLTWGGIALHAGRVPGYAASHGCVRLPLGFSKILYRETSLGMTVVVTYTQPSPQSVLDPGLSESPLPDSM
jgi:hypothetical protein